jgi:hypothetical protein
VVAGFAGAMERGEIKLKGRGEKMNQQAGNRVLHELRGRRGERMEQGKRGREEEGSCAWVEGGKVAGEEKMGGREEKRREVRAN